MPHKIEVFFNNTTGCKAVCKKKQITCEEVRDIVYGNYTKSGILVRGNDGQQVYSIKQIGNIIQNNALSTQDNPNPFNITEFNDGCGNLLFGSILSNLSPPYSASLISGINNNFPIAWYNFDYSEAFTNRDSSGNSGHRSLLAVILKNSKIVIKGGCIFDADSNLRNDGNIPPVSEKDKAIPGSLFSLTLPFKDISGSKYLYRPPSSQNNNPTVNPMFLPRTSTGVAENTNQVNQFLYEIAYLKQIFIEKIYGISGAFTTFINNELGTGVEPEILVKPKSLLDYYSQKFNPTDVQAFALISDSDYATLQGDVTDLSTELRNSINTFISTATGDTGWIKGTNNNYLKNLPVIGIFNVALPDLPLQGTSSSSKTGVGTQWKAYLDRSSSFRRALTKSDFICL
jgi:hypothetical protein